MLTTINDKFRDKIYTMKDPEVYKFMLESDLDTLEYVMGLLMSDMYKMEFANSYFKGNKLSINYMEECVDEFQNEILNDFVFLGSAIAATKRFRDLSLVSKSIMIDDLELTDKDKLLCRMFPYHVYDKFAYKFQNNLDTYILYYKNFLEKNNRIKSIIDYFLDKLKELKVINYEKYSNFMLEFIKSYYIYNCSNKKDFYIEKIANESLNDLITSSTINEGFVIEILATYLNYNILNEEKKEKIDEEFKNNADEKIKKKLKIK